MDRTRRVRDVERETIAASLRDTVDKAEADDIFDADREDLGALGLAQLKDWKWSDDAMPVLVPHVPVPACLEMETIVLVVHARVGTRVAIAGNAVLSLREAATNAERDHAFSVTITQGGRRAGCLTGTVRVATRK